MQVLGLSERQLMVHLNNTEDFTHRMRWIEILDYLLGASRFDTSSTVELHKKLCLLENTASWSTYHHWARSHGWSASGHCLYLGDRSQDWQVDLASGDGKRRLVARSSAAGHSMIMIRGQGLSDLQDPDPRCLQVQTAGSLEQMLVEIESFFHCVNNRRLELQSPRLSAAYSSEPVASGLLGLKHPRLRLKLGEILLWQQALSTSQTAKLPDSAFVHCCDIARRKHTMSVDLLRQACSLTLPGGLLRTDLPAVPSRAQCIPSKITLYHPANPYRAQGSSGK
jgi:hypothetical protein